MRGAESEIDRIKREMRDPKWTKDVIKVALAAKAQSQTAKGKNQPSVAVLEHQDLRSESDELMQFLHAFKNKLTDKSNAHFQIATRMIHFQNAAKLKHWLAVDVRIINGSPIFFVLDSIANQRFADKTIAAIKHVFSGAPTPVIFRLVIDNPIQKDGQNCSRFMLLNIYLLQKINSFYALMRSAATLNASGVRDVELMNLDPAFAKMLRSYQSLDELYAIPMSLMNATFNESKQYVEPGKTRGTTKLYQSLEKTTVPSTKHNRFIEDKTISFIEQIDAFLDKKSNEEIEKIIHSDYKNEFLETIFSQQLNETSATDLFSAIKASKDNSDEELLKILLSINSNSDPPLDEESLLKKPAAPLVSGGGMFKPPAPEDPKETKPNKKPGS